MPIKWNAAQRKKLHGFRTPHKSDPKDEAATLKEAWAILRALERRTAQGARKHVAIAEAVRDELAAPAPPAKLDPVRETYRASMVLKHSIKDGSWGEWGWARALVALWWEKGGPAFAARVMIQPTRYEGYKGSFKAVRKDMREPIAPWILGEEHEPLWWALRARVSRLDEAAFKSARAAIEPVFASEVTPATARHAWLTFAFDRDRELAQREITRALARAEAQPDALSRGAEPQGRPSFDAAEALLVAAPDADTALDLTRRLWMHAYGRISIDIVEAHGEGARPLLAAKLEQVLKYSAKQYHKHMIAALALVEG